MKKWNIPLTYAPKIQPVIDGTCRQTIRTGRKFSVGDLIRFYTWAGRPYHSKRTTVTGYTEIIYCNNITIYHYGINSDTREAFNYNGLEWEELNWLSEKDGIVPPTGEALAEVLKKMNVPIPATGAEAQIVRW